MKRYAKIFVSCLLTFTMVFTSVQWSAIVHETTVVGAAETVPKEKKEVVEEENTKDSTTFQMEDGKKQTVFTDRMSGLKIRMEIFRSTIQVLSG